MTKRNYLYLAFVAALWMMMSSSFLPDKPSELATIMRQMLRYLKTERLRVEEGSTPLPLPKSFQKISTAQLTPGKKLSGEHHTYATDFLQKAALYTAAVPADRKNAYNVMVSSCITCHERECPGPVQTIRQNLIR